MADRPTDKELRDLMRMARGMAVKRGHPNLADDFAQEVAITAFAEGSTALRLDWALNNFLRRELGDMNTGAGRRKRFERTLRCSLDAPLGDDDDRTLHDLVGAPEPEEDEGQVERPALKDRLLLFGRDALVHELHFVEGVRQVELSRRLGVCQGTVSNAKRRVVKEITHAAVLSEAWDRYASDPEYSQLEVRWITL